MKRCTLLFILITISCTCHSQSLETTLYLKEELTKQRDALLEQAKVLQKRIDSIDQRLKGKSKPSTQYLTKSVNYNATTKYSNSLNKSSPKKKRRKARTSKKYIRGSRGGCYYINGNGNKTYVNRSLCN